MKAYLELTSGGQMRRLRKAAVDACQKLGIEPGKVQPLNHGENTTFAVTEPNGKKWNLRLHRPGYQTRASVESELEFLAKLHPKLGSGFVCPGPHRQGTVIATAPGVEDRIASALEWIDGKFLGDGVEPRHLFAVGKVTARLHQFAEAFSPSAPFTRNAWHDPIALSENAVAEIEAFVPAEDFVKARNILEDRIAVLGKSAEYGLIHADLHLGNVFFAKGAVAVIDFDDLGWAHHAYDYAVSLTQFRNAADFVDLREAYGEGYETLRPLPKGWRDRLEVFLAARIVAMTQWFMMRKDNPRLRGYAAEALPRWAVEMERYVRTGSLRPA
jgi:Ser/Thr protein kinase RdoA (MazF antagonist)